MYLCIRLKISTKFMPQNLCIDQFDARTEWRCDFATAIKQFTKYFVKTVYRMAKNVSSDFQRLLVFPIERYSCLTALDILSIRKHLQPLKVTLDVYLPFYNIVFPQKKTSSLNPFIYVDSLLEPLEFFFNHGIHVLIAMKETMLKTCQKLFD